jgi:hypothetical protein
MLNYQRVSTTILMEFLIPFLNSKLNKNPQQLRGMMCTSPFQDEKTFGFLTLGKLSSRRPAPSCSWPWIQGAMKGVGAGMGLGLADATFVPSDTFMDDL